MMHIHINHYTCFSPTWGDENYECHCVVAIHKAKPDGRLLCGDISEDWVNLITERKETIRLNNKAIKWLEDNVKDRQDDVYSKGYALGTDEYNNKNSVSFEIFFHRIPDAMAFVKAWSVIKKPIEYSNYFTDSRKKYDFRTRKMIKQ
jgi:hypothetical protein